LEALGPIGGRFGCEALARQLQGQALGELLVVFDNEQAHPLLQD
jgi:hypothetical protein